MVDGEENEGTGLEDMQLSSSGRLLLSLQQSAGDLSSRGTSNASPLRMTAALEGEPLTRLTSLEKLGRLQNQRPQKEEEEARDYAAARVQSWYRRCVKIRGIFSTVQRSLPPPSDGKLSSMIFPSSKTATFSQYQQMLENSSNRLSSFLSAMPLDPHLKKANTQARSARTFTCCLLMSYFPEEVLLSEGETRDDSLAVSNCYIVARMLTVSTKLLLNTLETKSSTVRFYKNFLVYRYTMRSFLKHFDVWKAVDAERVALSLELPFIQAYSVVLATRAAIASSSSSPTSSSSEEEAAENQRTLEQSQIHLGKIKTMYMRLRGSAACDRLEELEALVASSNPMAFLVEHLIPAAAEEAAQDARMPRSLDNLSSEISSSAAAAAAASAASNEAKMEEAQVRLLEKLSLIAGVENERLAYEVCVNPSYKLPDSQDPTTTIKPYQIDVPAPSAAAQSQPPSPATLRAQMLRLISDRLVWSLLPSPWKMVEDVVVGSVGPWRVQSPNSTEQQQQQQIITGRILAVNSEEEGYLFVDVEFLVDGVVEKHIPLLADAGSAVYSIKWEPPAGEPQLSDPEPFLQSLEDCCNRIGALTPKRPELLQQLVASMDMPLLHQMLSTRSIGGEELSVVAAKLFYAVDQLVSPFRLDEPTRKQWIQSFLSELRGAATFQERILLLPALFEFVTLSAEQVGRDMANYYVAGLAPVLHQHGRSFLSGKLLQRVRDGKSSLKVLATSVIQQLGPATQLKRTIDELAEAGVVGAQQVANVGGEIVVGELLSADWLRDGVVALVLLNLLKLPARLDTRQAASLIPETLLWDAKRLAVIRDEMDRVVVLNALAITSKQHMSQLCATLPGAIRGGVVCSPDQEEEFLRRLDILLHETDCSLPQLFTETRRHVKDCIASRFGQAGTLDHLPAGADWETQLEAGVKGALMEKSAVLGLFTKRVVKIMLAAALRLPWKPKLTKFSMSNKIIEAKLSRLVGLFQATLASTLSCYGDVYAWVLESESVREFVR